MIVDYKKLNENANIKCLAAEFKVRFVPLFPFVYGTYSLLSPLQTLILKTLFIQLLVLQTLFALPLSSASSPHVW